MTDATTVVNYFLALQEAEDAGDALTNLKLQKLLYYAQGYYLGENGEPLFPERIEAWQHGPVVAEIYHSLKYLGASPVPMPEGFDVADVDSAIRDHLEQIWNLFGQFSAWKLRDMTHSDKPYVEAYEAGANTEITHQAMADFFAPFVVEA